MIPRSTATPLLIMLASATVGLAQEMAQVEPAADDAATTTAPGESSERPGRFRAGPFYFTPYIKVGSIGFDSNVLYTQAETQPDFSVSGGPGIETTLPIRQASRLTLDTGLTYLYFARTESQRRLNAYGRVLLAYDPFEYAPAIDGAIDEYRPQRRAWIEERYENTHARISLELDERVPRTEEGTSAEILFPILGRFALQVEGQRERSEIQEEALYLGNDLRRTVNKDRYLAAGALRYSVTIKTTLVARGDKEFHRFAIEPERDGDITRLLGGVETDTTALISGHALAGVGRFHRKAGGPDRDSTEVDVDAMINFTPRTRLGGGYRQGLGLSILSTPAAEPTSLTKVSEVRIGKDLWDRFDLRMYGRLTEFTTDGPVAIVQPDGTTEVQRRDDRSQQAGLDLGYTFKPDVRIGIDVSYTTRESNFAFFDIQGFVVGFTVNYVP